MRRASWTLPVLVPAALIFGACSPAPTPAPARNLDRPTDIAFACVGLFGDQVSGRPMNECNPPLQFDPLLTDPSHPNRSYGFVPNTNRGELSVIDMNTNASVLLDLDSGTPGNTSVPIGDLPEQISVSDDGCRLVTANRGSCNLTLIDPSVLVSSNLRFQLTNVVPPATGPETATVTKPITKGDGMPLQLAPQEILFLPQNTLADTMGNNLCPAGPTVAPATPWRALVTFPSCDMVALIDLPSGQIVDSVTLTATAPTADNPTGITPTHTGASPSCLYMDCDAGTRPPLNGPSGLARPRPGALAIMPDGSRAYVGLAGAEAIYAVDVSPTTLTPAHAIQLHEGPLGVDRVRLSVDPYLPAVEPGSFGRFVGEGPDRLRQYLYALTRDGTVRVVDVSPAARLAPEVECDTNVDPSLIPADQRANPCFAVEADPNHLLRRPSAQGPGIRLPVVPEDVAFADLKLGDARQQVLDGSYGFILTSSGAVFIVNIDPTPRTLSVAASNTMPTPAPAPEPQPLVSSLRNKNVITFASTLDPSTGPARVEVAPTPPASGPQLQGISTSSALDNATLTGSTTNTSVDTFAFFPEETDVRPQSWTITWEGDLFGVGFAGQIVTPAVVMTDPQTNRVTTVTPATFKDVGVDFCQAGTLKGDLINIFGCTDDSQCGPTRVCRHSDTAPPTAGSLPINGLCVDADAPTQAMQLAACAQLLGSVRRYEVTDARERQLSIRPNLDEPPQTLVTGCQVDADCHLNAADSTWANFACLEVEGVKRCVQPCTNNTDHPLPSCRTGRLCVAFGSDVVNGPDGLCADGPPLTDDLRTQCLRQLFGYKIQAGSSFTIQGTAGAPTITFAVDAAGVCQSQVPGRNPLLANRIPVRPASAVPDPLSPRVPACTNDPKLSADPTTWSQSLLPIIGHDPNTQALGPGFSPDPCSFEAPTAATLSAGQTKSEANLNQHFIAFQNTELRLIISHLQESTPDIAAIKFDVHGGFAPDSVGIPATIDIGLPARIVVGPFDSQAQLADQSVTHELPFLFVVDQRRLGRAAAGVGATRGQILRINPRKANSDGSSLLPIYDEPDTTGNHWPIQ